jgi:hypothetical protein
MLMKPASGRRRAGTGSTGTTGSHSELPLEHAFRTPSHRLPHCPLPCSVAGWLDRADRVAPARDQDERERGRRPDDGYGRQHGLRAELLEGRPRDREPERPGQHPQRYVRRDHLGAQMRRRAGGEDREERGGDEPVAEPEEEQGELDPVAELLGHIGRGGRTPIARMLAAAWREAPIAVATGVPAADARAAVGPLTVDEGTLSPAA